MFHRVIAHGMLSAGLISNVLGTKLPGPGTIYLGQDLRFTAPVDIGDTITATLTVAEKSIPRRATSSSTAPARTKRAMSSSAARLFVRAPRDKVRRPRVELPEVQISRHDRFRALMAAAAGHAPAATAVAYPCDATRLALWPKPPRRALSCRFSSGPRTNPAAAAAAKVDVSLSHRRCGA